ncbi:hypothetical protein ACHWQZ_G014864 [Mnemiopsis leidyi]
MIHGLVEKNGEDLKKSVSDIFSQLGEKPMFSIPCRVGKPVNGTSTELDQGLKRVSSDRLGHLTEKQMMVLSVECPTLNRCTKVSPVFKYLRVRASSLSGSIESPATEQKRME